MRADNAYRLIVRRGGFAPALLADTRRLDRVEIVDIEEGECLMFWDCAPRQASKLARALREDLHSLDAGAFLSKWT